MTYLLIILIALAAAAWWIRELRLDDGRISEEERRKIEWLREWS